MKNVMIALAMTGMIASPAAFAGEQFDFEFSFDRATLQTEEGAQATYDRLQDQIKDACKFASSRKGLSAVRYEKQCIAAATEETVQKINSDSLKTAHFNEVSQNS